MAQAVPGLGETFDRIPSAFGPEQGSVIGICTAREIGVEAFLVSTGIVALAEIGDKTQLLAFTLAAMFRRSTPIVLGILVATLANHAFAGALGAWITHLLPKETLRIFLALSFLLMAAWILVPDKRSNPDVKLAALGVFGATLTAFFFAEMGDKTQMATVALAGQYQALAAVVSGTTLGMMIANVPAVLLGERIAPGCSARWARLIAAGAFVVLGVATLLGYGERLGL